MAKADVTTWQNALLAAGYEVGRVDGDFGPSTLRASLKALRGEIGGTNGHAPTTSGDYVSGTITERVAMELIAHEAIVPEAYKDSVGVWTWGVGVTDASGHGVMRYKDNPQPISHCLAVYLWLLREKYAPAVVKAFGSHRLTESQFGAALSFHYNTGAIGRATWVRAFLDGDGATARSKFMEWKKPAAIIERRAKERDLFFSGQWTSDGKATVYPVRKPSYSPDWKGARRIDIRDDLRAAMGQ